MGEKIQQYTADRRPSLAISIDDNDENVSSGNVPMTSSNKASSRFLTLPGTGIPPPNNTPCHENILPNNNFTTSELLSMKHALAVHNSNANNNSANNNNNNANMQTGGRRSRSSSFYTSHTNNSNSHLNSYLNNNAAPVNDIYMTAKTSPMSNENRPSIDGSIASVNNNQQSSNNTSGNTNPLYGVISSPNSTKSITAASQLINDLLNSNNSTNILQAQQIPDLGQIMANTGVPMNHSASRNSVITNANSSSRPQLQSLITSESGLRAISESNYKHDSKFSSKNGSRRNSDQSLLDNNSIDSNANFERIPFSSIDANYKQLRSPNRETPETSALELPITPRLEHKTSTTLIDPVGSSSATTSNFNTSRNNSIPGHTHPSVQQISSFSAPSKQLATPTSRHSQQSSANQLFQPNFQMSSSSLNSKVGLLQHQQYSINEKQYLKKIKQSQQQNDYYNKSIFDLSSVSMDDSDSVSTTDPNSADALSELQTPVLHRASSLKDSYFVKQPTKKSDRLLTQNLQLQDPNATIDDAKLKKLPAGKGKKHRLKNKLEKTSDLKYIDKIYLKELDKVGKHYKKGDIHKLSFLSDGDETFDENSAEEAKKLGKDRPNEVNERLAWQLMLTRVLTGDIVTKEKSKLKDLKECTDEGDKTNFKNELWLELKAWMNGQTSKEHEKTLQLLRNSVADEIFESISNFKMVSDIPISEAKSIVRNLVDNYEKVTSYWGNLTDMYAEKPMTNTSAFKQRIALLNSWINCSDMIDDLIVKISKNADFNESGDDYEIKSTYIEKIVKEENIQEIFQEFYNFQAQTIFKSNLCIRLYYHILQELNIPLPLVNLRLIVIYTPKLIRKVILSRIQVANDLANPTMMMLDQIIDDLAHYIKLATEIKTTVTHIPIIATPDIGSEIDEAIKLAINHVYEIIVLKLETKGVGLFSSTKDTDEILEQWEVFRNIGCFLGEEYGFVVAFMFLKLFLQLMMKLHVFAYLKFNSLPNFKKESDATDWILSCIETFSSFERRFSRFFATLSSSLRNQINFKTKAQTKVIDTMVDHGYALVYTGGDLEDQGFYCFVSEELILKNGGNIEKEVILASLNNSYICSDLVPAMDMNKTLALSSLLYEANEQNEAREEDYCEPQNNIYWEKLTKNGIQCQDMKFDESVGNIFFVANGVKLPAFLYEKNGGNDIRVKSQNSISYLVNNTNILDEYMAVNNLANANVNTPTALNAETDLSLKISEATLRGTGHVVLLKPENPLLWEGNALYLNTPITLNELYMFKRTKKEYEEGNNLDASENTNDEIFISPSMKECDFIVFTEASPMASDYLLDKIMVQFGVENLEFVNKSSSINIVEKLLRKTSKIAFNFHETIITSYPQIKKKINKRFRGLQTINNGYLFCRDLTKEFIGVKENYIEEKYKTKMLKSMLDTAVDWVSFICHESKPTDLETFRWCVPAMECAMNLTSSENILSLNKEKYQILKTSVSGCMALLISHFDVMGGRARALEENKFLFAAQQKLLGKEISLDDYDDDTLLEINSQVRMESIKAFEKQLRKIDKHKRKVGKVLNDSYKEDKYIAKLASSLSNVTIKWRKKEFVGGGSFGDVFSAVNLDTGGVLAVKQIKIQRSKNMEKIFPRIKDEMTVLEVLNHPNIVQYYGVEVHRDKVNIFMEYCDGGSLASLLEHGRFEDEVITQVYSLELLEGMAYLHQSGVVHRDIKPENILLDHNGVVKYVDFGAAELVTKQGTKKIGTRSMMQSSKSIGQNTSSNNKNNDMMGTPMYMAPENITGKKRGSRLGSDDIWSLGCVILEMTTGRRPWANLDNEWAIMYHVAAGHIPQFPSKDQMSVVGSQFLSKMLRYNPDQRSTAVELLLDPWIADIRKLAFNTSNSSSSLSDLEYAGSTPTTATTNHSNE